MNAAGAVETVMSLVPTVIVVTDSGDSRASEATAPLAITLVVMGTAALVTSMDGGSVETVTPLIMIVTSADQVTGGPLTVTHDGVGTTVVEAPSATATSAAGENDDNNGGEADQSSTALKGCDFLTTLEISSSEMDMGEGISAE